MNKFIKINYHSIMWKDGVRVAYKTNGGASTLILSLGSIKSISEPVEFGLFESQDAAKGRGTPTERIKLRLVATDIAYGRGINGVDYEGYWVTEETFERLVSAIEVL